MEYAGAFFGVFAVGVVVLLVGTATRRVVTALAGLKAMEFAVIGIPIASAIARLIRSPLPADASLAWRAVDILVSVVVLLLGAAVFVWIVRLRTATVDE